MRCLKQWVQKSVDNTYGRDVLRTLRCPTCKEHYRGDALLLLASSQALSLQLDLPQSCVARLVTELQERGMRGEAKALQRRISDWKAIVAETGHPDSLYGLMGVAEAMVQLRQFPVAATLMRRVLKSSEKRLQPDLEEILAEDWGMSTAEVRGERADLAREAAGGLARVLELQGRAEEAEAMRARLQALQRRSWNQWAQDVAEQATEAAWEHGLVGAVPDLIALLLPQRAARLWPRRAPRFLRRLEIIAFGGSGETLWSSLCAVYLVVTISTCLTILAMTIARASSATLEVLASSSK